MISDYFPNAKFETINIPGSTGAYEIYINGVKIHSKLNGDGFIKEEKIEDFLEDLTDALEDTL